jgi:sugar phosphate isomerase/epimerase
MTGSFVRRMTLAFAGASMLAVTALPMGAANAADQPAWRNGMALQLYTFHTQLEKDLPGTLAMIKQLGFDRVETYPVANTTAAQLRAALDAAGLKAVSAHMPWDRIKDDLPGVVADAKTLGVEQFGPGSINLFDGKGFRPMSLDIADQSGEILAEACAAAKAAGMRVFIHTHGNEFQQANGTTPLERMSEKANNCFDIEADVYWVKWAGADPVALVKRYGSRVSSLHVKDMGAGAAGHEPGKIAPSEFPVAGKGTLDLKGLMQASRQAGVRWYIIEDESDRPAEQIPQSLVYLDTIGK